MLFYFKQKPAYYSVHALRDGTIWFVLQGRKPAKSQNPIIDEDGIYQWHLDEVKPDELSDWGQCLLHSTVATCLNVKRIVRHQVEGKLDLILKRLDEISQRLDRLEQHAAKQSPQNT